MTSRATRRTATGTLLALVIGALVAGVPAVATSSGNVGAATLSTAPLTCGATNGAVTAVNLPSVTATMYRGWYGRPGPGGTKIGAQYARAQAYLTGLRGTAWVALAGTHQGAAAVVNLTARTLPAPAAFAGATQVPAGYDAYRVVLQVLWYNPLKPNTVDGTTTTVLQSYTTAGTRQSACLPRPARPGTVTATATTTGFTLTWAKPTDPYLASTTVRYAVGATPPATPGAGTALGLGSAGTTAAAGGLRPATTYSYGVWFTDVAGQVSAATTGSVTTARLSTVKVPGVANAVTVAAGGADTCAVTSGGAVLCWGANDHHQLGTGTTAARSGPVQVTTSVRTASGSLAVGNGFACAITTASQVSCWGANDHGQLGDGTVTERGAPRTVPGLSDVTQLTAGADHACALTTTQLAGLHSLYCWGANAAGQLGDGTTVDRHAPVAVATGALQLLEMYAQVSAGADHTCAVTTGSAVLCWGANAAGQLGTGTTTGSTTPVRIAGLQATAVAAGTARTCAQVRDGVRCWGDNSAGGVGDGTTLARSSPTAVSGLGAVSAIAGSAASTCALQTTGAVSCWGENSTGQLGDGTIEQRLTPVTVSGVGGALGVAAGSGHGCAVLADRSLACWGSDSQLQLGS